MRDTAETVPIAPAAPAAPLPASAPGLPAPRRRIARILLAPFRFAWRRPWRALGVLVLCLLLVSAVGAVGLLLWAHHHLNLAREAVARGQNWAAVRHLDSCRLVWPNHPEAILLCACVARRSGSWTEAEELLDRYWKIRGDDDALVLERLLLRTIRGDVEAVRPLLQGRIDRGDPETPLIYEALVNGLLYRYRLDEAQKLSGRWLDSQPDSTFALLARGKLQELREQNSEAAVTYRRLLELDPKHDEVRWSLAGVLIQIHQGEEALPHAEYLRKRLPNHAGIMVRLAQALELQGRTGEARSVLDECLGIAPDNATALVERGRLARLDGDGELAERYLQRSIALDPGEITPHYQYYLTLNLNGKKAEAEKVQAKIRQLEAEIHQSRFLIDERLPRSPDDPAIYHELALLALRARRPHEALRWLLNALQADPDHLPTHRTLSLYYHETGNPILAARHRAIAQRLSARP